MASNSTETNKQLTALWKDNTLLTLDTARKKYILMSDLHMGNGGGADDLRDNEEALLKALDYYKKNGFTLLLLGDIEELWQFDIEEVKERYNKTVYDAFRKFGEDRLYRIFGNHDFIWRGETDPVSNATKPFGSAVEAIKLKDTKGDLKILILHGHQGSVDADKLKWFSQFWVRCYRYVEPAWKWIGFGKNGSVAMSQVPTDYEKTVYEWAKKNKVVICCGHSHRAIFASRSYIDLIEEDIRALQKQIKETSDEKKIEKLIEEIDKLTKDLAYEKLRKRKIDPTEDDKIPVPCYFNTGCGLYNDGLTAIEIQGNDIRLVKWNRKLKRAIYNEGKLSKFIDKL